MEEETKTCKTCKSKGGVYNTCRNIKSDQYNYLVWDGHPACPNYEPKKEKK